MHLVGNLVFLELRLLFLSWSSSRAHTGSQEPTLTSSLSKSPSWGGQSRQSPPSVCTHPSGTAGSSTERPEQASHLQHRPQDTGSSQVAGGPHWGPRAGPTGTLPGWTRSTQTPRSPQHPKKAPGGPSLLTERAVPTADDLLVWNPLPILTSKRKNKLYLPGKEFTPPSWTTAHNICLFQKRQ